MGKIWIIHGGVEGGKRIMTILASTSVIREVIERLEEEYKEVIELHAE